MRSAFSDSVAVPAGEKSLVLVHSRGRCFGTPLLLLRKALPRKLRKSARTIVYLTAALCNLARSCPRTWVRALAS